MTEYLIRIATLHDINVIHNFVDFWLSGTGKHLNFPDTSNHYTIPLAKHRTFITKYTTFLLFHQQTLIGWAVLQPKKHLIFLLIAGTYRHHGHGTHLLKHIDPDTFQTDHKKTSPDLLAFYTKKGYQIETKHTRNNNKNIDIYVRKTPKCGTQ